MFGNSKNQKQNKTVSKVQPNPMSINSLVEGTSIEGHLSSKSDIRIDGKLNGTLECAGKVIIGPTGFIQGEINCKFAVIEGRFEGTVIVEDTLQVREKAMINGDVTTGKLIVQTGAIFNVTCKMGGQVLGDYKNKLKAVESPRKEAVVSN